MRPDQAVSEPVEPAKIGGLRRRLTRAECVFLSAALLFILAAGIPAWVAARHRRQHVMTRLDMAALERAIRRYHREYGTWPAPSQAGGLDVRYGRQRPNADLMRILRAEPGSGNSDHVLNPQQLVFIEMASHAPGWSGLDERGEFLDPWGMPYQIVLDSNYDNAAQVENSIYGRMPGTGVMIWSCGPDRISETRDDLISWQM